MTTAQLLDSYIKKLADRDAEIARLRERIEELELELAWLDRELDQEAL